jgi:hypothetical protein
MIDNEAIAELNLQLFEGQKPSKRVILWGGNGLDKCNKTSSQYSTYNFIFISYVEFCAMPTF